MSLDKENQIPEGLVYYFNCDENHKIQSINFGSEYKFDFNIETNTLNIEKNNQYIPYFYNEGDSKVIQNLSLIVGKNGSGKTSILREILRLISTNGWEGGFIIVYVLEGIIYYFSNYQVEIEKQNINLNIVNASSEDSSLFYLHMKYFNFIFLSNSFDYVRGFYNKSNQDHVYDLTTNGLIAENYLKKTEYLEIVYKEDPLKLYEKYTTTIILDFLLDDQMFELVSLNRNIVNFKLELELIKELRIRTLSLFLADCIELFFKSFKSIDVTDNSYVAKVIPILNNTHKKNNTEKYLSSLEVKVTLDLLQTIKYEYLKNTSNEESKRIIVIEELLEALQQVLNLVLVIEKIEQGLEDNTNDNRILESLKIKILISLYSYRLSMILGGRSFSIGIGTKKEKGELFLSSFKGQINIFFDDEIKFFIEMFSNRYEFWEASDKILNQVAFLEKLNDFNLVQINKKNEILFNSKEVYGYLKQEFLNYSVSLDKLFDISFPQLSSGELALINLFSRIYSLKEKLVKQDKVILFIDEADLYLHPQWQKQLVSKFIKFCTTVFHDMKVQIIMTTNSAIPVSDVLKHNVILLGDGSRKHLDNYRNTFGGNIFNLLSDTFFIQDGFIGDFAQMKIQDLIDILYDKDIDYLVEHMDEIEKRINLIGEDLIKNKLLEILEQRLSANLLSIKNTLNKIEQRLNNLEEKRNN